MDYKDLAELIFPDVKDISYYEEKYPERNLPEGAVVTRFAPSPTGFVHIGGLYQALVARTVAKKTGGVFFLRVEDTDQKREVENGVTGIVNSLKDFDMAPDEGMISDTEEIGNYGPYKQSLRKEIYQAYAKYLIAQGKAYPCFCTQEELDEIRQKDILLEICPTSNVQTNVINDIKYHPVRKLYDANILVSINTDNNTVSNVTLTTEYEKLAQKLNFTYKDFVKMNKDAIRHAFISEDEKEQLLQKYDEKLNQLS